MDNDAALLEHCKKRLPSLKKLANDWHPIWREVSDFLLPRRGKFLCTGTKGREKNGRINDGTGPLALRTFRSGMMGNATSPARPWFKLGVEDSTLADNAAVRMWLDEVRKRMLAVFAKSNIYSVLHQAYEEIGAFGTLVIILEQDFEDVIRGTCLTVGEYYLAEDKRGVVDTLYREVKLTVAQIVGRWGKTKVSSTIADAFANKQYDVEHLIVHAIEPNPDYIEGTAGPRGMKFRSVYYDPADTDLTRVLSKKGYRRFPALCARWDLTSGDVYGRSVGMEALPDLRQLTQMEKRLAQALDKMVNPPMQGPVELENKAVSGLPGAITYVADSSKGGLTPIYAVDPKIQGFTGKMEEVRQRLRRWFHEDLFLMLANLEGVQPRNEMEIAERKDEKMLVLGPAYLRLQNELFSQLIEYTFGTMEDVGLMPDAPEEIHGQNVDVDYISPLALAQKSAGITGIERFASFIGRVASVKPDALDKWDADQSIDEYGDTMGISPKTIVSDERVSEIRAARLQQQQAAQQAAMAQQAAAGAKVLSETDVGGGANALQRMLGAA